MESRGVLYLCATPIGNLEDITLRSLRILKEVDLVAAEDTRHARKLFSHFDIHTPLTSYHDHNSRSKGRYLVNLLMEGKNIALVTDAGMPGVSDPGEELTAMAVSEGIRVVPLPGASASISALVVSGLPTERFCFEGFLPARGKERKRRLEDLRSEKRTIIFYESPHRLRSTLSDFIKFFGDRQICIARELTKYYEEVWRGSLEEAVLKFKDQMPRGEFTLVMEGVSGLLSPEVSGTDNISALGSDDLAEMVSQMEKGGVPRKEAIKEVSRKSGKPRREVYSALVEQKKSGGINTP
ncbi:MAG: 16S rRNA (cytidine(1402)-2'-O)-methyltransferase [Bacillota bacterium]